ncbi:MAG: hypothetical protein AAF790_00330 [Planctomycetota bacterium]
MNARRDYHSKAQLRQSRRRNAAANARRESLSKPKSRRVVGQRNAKLPFAPPEDWHEPSPSASPYRIVTQPAGDGYRHVVTPDEVRERLSTLPSYFLRDLEVVQLSRITRKKQSFPCYGMQWGPALYLYPLESSLEEHFDRPPSPSVVNEARMYGGVWRETASGCWSLVWTEQTIRDFYLNNILIHELGHLLDDRNTSYTDRERFAEWFAIEYGYRPTRGAAQRRRQVRRRHHSR